MKSAPAEFVVRGAAPKRKAVTWYSVGLAACAYGIVWSVLTWSGPNLKFASLDQSAHHVTRVSNIVWCVIGLVELFTMMRLAVGWLPTAVVRVGESGDVEVAATPWLPGFPMKFKPVVGPVLVEYRFIKGDRRMVSRWDLWFRGARSKVRVGTIWPLRDDDIEALKAELESRREGRTLG